MDHEKPFEHMTPSQLRRAAGLMYTALVGLEGSTKKLVHALDEGDRQALKLREPARKARQMAMLVLWQVAPNNADMERS